MLSKEDIIPSLSNARLSNLYNRNDIFWFTFFHEAGHIIKHGKKDVFVEGLKYSAEEQIKEDEANNFAVKYTFTKAQEKEVLANIPPSRYPFMNLQ